MNNNLNSFARQLNKKLKSFAASSYMQLVELNDAVNKVAKTVDGDPYEYIQIDDTISAMKSTSNKFLNQVYNVGATVEQVSKFSNKMRGMENKVGQLLAKDHPSDIFYFQFSNVSHALDKLIPSNIASQKPKEHIEERENNNPEKIGPNTFSGKLSDVIDAGPKPLSRKDLLDKDNEFYKENPYAGNSSNPAEFNEEIENRKGASRKLKLTKEAGQNIDTHKLIEVVRKVLEKVDTIEDKYGHMSGINEIYSGIPHDLLEKVYKEKGNILHTIEALYKLVKTYDEMAEDDVNQYNESNFPKDDDLSIRDEDDLESNLED